MSRPDDRDPNKLYGESLIHYLSARPGELNRAIEIGKKLGHPRYIGDWNIEQCRDVVARMGRIKAGVN